MRSSSGSASSRGPVQDISDAEDLEAVFADLLRPPDEPSAPPVQPPPSPGVDQSVDDFWEAVLRESEHQPQPEEEPAAVQPEPAFVRPDFVPAHWPPS